ncbi:MAG: HAD family hydrolase [Proteobacteria bacterium]|nr:HAD family hydrolase [Pseudomonadota bacterium]
MSKLSKPRAVLFDLDGTLTDRTASVRSYANVFSEHFGARLQGGEVARLASVLVDCDHGGYNPRRAHDVIARLAWIDPPAAAEVAAHWERASSEAVVARRGLGEMLAGLSRQGLTLGVVTNGPSDGQRRKLARLETADAWDAIVISEEVGFEKPDPRIFEAALRQLGAPAAATWFVGDHPENDIAGAEACGLTAFWIQAAVAWPAERPPARDRLEGLPELAARLAACA